MPPFVSPLALSSPPSFFPSLSLLFIPVECDRKDEASAKFDTLNSPPRTCSPIRDNPVSGAARMNELGVAHLSRFSLYLASARRLRDLPSQSCLNCNRSSVCSLKNNQLKNNPARTSVRVLLRRRALFSRARSGFRFNSNYLDFEKS